MVNPTALQEETKRNVLAVDQKVAGIPVLKQATFTGSLAGIAAEATLVALDATGGAMKDIRVKVFIDGATAGNITPRWYVTRYGALITFTEQTVPSLGAAHALAAAAVEDYEVGDLPEGLQGELRIYSAANEAGRTFEATVTYLQ